MDCTVWDVIAEALQEVMKEENELWHSGIKRTKSHSHNLSINPHERKKEEESAMI